MLINKIKLTVLLSLVITALTAQSGTIRGTITSGGEFIAHAQVMIDSTSLGTTTNSKGSFVLSDVPFGTYTLTASFIGYAKVSKHITINEQQPEVDVDIALVEQTFQLGNIVITGTKTFKRQTNSPVIVNVINSQTINKVQACNLSEGLKFQPGLRVETNCQTCNYTQLRMNGLAGGYSQILINGRPIFSPITGLYGMEQLPANMIDKIEVVRGGGSSLYGSSAIGGTVNVITKVPTKNYYELDHSYQHIDGQTLDQHISGNASVVSQSRNSGISFFINHRARGFYDANEDNFSEIPLIKNTAFGTNFFYLLNDNQKLEFNVSHINEYRLGGEMLTDIAAHLTQQSEERTHDVWMASADYQINFNQDNSSIITYLAFQHTDREHYTGILPDEGTAAYDDFLTLPPYGTSAMRTINVGAQLNHKINDFVNGTNVITLGTEYLYEDVLDEIPTYQYLIDQTTKNLGLFIQSDWAIFPRMTLLSGVRIDKHSLVDKIAVNPRAALLYKLKENTQFRLSYGTGFRAPQAFDTDLHIAFAGGGISRISLSPYLSSEHSKSYSASINYDKPMQNWVAGFTIERFYTRLNDVFLLQPIGQDLFGELFEKQNGEGATVSGSTIEVRANYKQKIQVESGYTHQSSLFDQAVPYIAGIEGIREFIRTPNDYGYAILSLTPSKRWNANINYIYTGKMKVPHFAGSPNQIKDEIITSPAFSAYSIKVGYQLPIAKLGHSVELYGGIKNISNAYQSDFDIGKNRDSNFIYGPSLPRTYYIGIKLKSN